MTIKLRKVVNSIAAIAIVLGSVLAFSAPKVLAATPAYDYQWIRQSEYPTNLTPGQVVQVWVEVKNTGTATWYSNTNNAVKLGTGSNWFGAANQKQDYSSEIYDGSWLGLNRAASFSPGVGPALPPGYHTRFTFNIKAPMTNGTYKAYFTPVAEYLTWMKDVGMYWQVTVGSGGGEVINPGAPMSVSLSSNTPAAASIPNNARGVTFAKYTLNGGSSASTLTNLTVKRVGAGVAGDFDAVYLYDGDVRLTNSRTVNSSNNEVTFTGFSVSVPANGTKVLSIVADVAGGVSNNNAFQIESASKMTGATFGGNFPITGNYMTFTNATVGGVTVARSGSVTDPKIGETNVKIGEFKVSANGEDITLRRIALTNFGSVSSANLTSLSLKSNGAEVATGSFTKDLATFSLANPMTILNGSNKIFQLYASVTGRVGDTIEIGVDDDADVYATGNTYGYGANLTNSYDSTTTSDSVLIGGTITITSSGPAAADISKDVQDKVFLNLAIASEVNAEVRNIVLHVNGSNLDSDYFSDVKIMDGSTIVAGPKSPTDDFAADLTFTDRFMLTAGQTRNLTVTMDISNNVGIGDDTVSVDLIAFAGDNDIKNIDTNAYVTDANIVPSSNITGKTMSIKASGLTVSLASTPVSQSVVINKNNVDTTGFLFTAAAASAVTITSVKFTGYIDNSSPYATFVGGSSTLRDTVSSVTLYNATTGLAVGSPKSLAADGTVVFSGLAINVPASGTVKLIPRVNVSNADSSCAFSFDIAQDGITGFPEVTSQDSNSNDIEEIGIDVNGGTSPTTVVTVTANGTLNAQVSAATPVATIAQAGATAVEFTKVKFYAIGEAFTVSELGVNIVGGGATAVNDVVLVSDSTSVTGSPSGSSLRFTGLAIAVPKDGNVEVTLKANLNTISGGATSGDDFLIEVNEDDIKATGTDSGQILLATTNNTVNLQGNTMVLRKTKPVISTTSTSGTLAGNVTLYSMNVAAGSGADTSIKQLTFDISASLNVAAADGTGTITGIEVYKDGSKVLAADVNIVTTSGTTIVDGDTQLVVSWKTGKELVIAQGSSSTIAIKGTTNVASPSTFTARLSDENTTSVETGNVIHNGADNIYEVDADLSGTLNGAEANRSIIWSDNSSTSHNASVPSTSGDWSNGYPLKELPGATFSYTRS